MNTSNNPLVWLLAGALILFTGIVLAACIFLSALLLFPQFVSRPHGAAVDARVVNPTPRDANEEIWIDAPEESSPVASTPKIPDGTSSPDAAGRPAVPDAVAEKNLVRVENPQEAVVLFELELKDDAGDVLTLAIGSGFSITHDLVVTTAQTGIEIDRLLASQDGSRILTVSAASKKGMLRKGRVHQVILLPPVETRDGDAAGKDAPGINPAEKDAAAKETAEEDATLRRHVRDVALVQIDIGVVSKQLRVIPQSRSLSKNMNRSPPLTVVGPIVQLHEKIQGVVIRSDSDPVSLKGTILKPISLPGNAAELAWKVSIESSLTEKGGMLPRDAVVLNSEHEVVGLISSIELVEDRPVAIMADSTRIAELLSIARTEAGDGATAAVSPVNADAKQPATGAKPVDLVPSPAAKVVAPSMEPEIAGNAGKADSALAAASPVYAILSSIGVGKRPNLKGTWQHWAADDVVHDAELTVSQLDGAEILLRIKLSGIEPQGDTYIDMKGPVSREGALVQLTPVATYPESTDLVQGLQIWRTDLEQAKQRKDGRFTIEFDTSSKQLCGTATFQID